jgi:hypothetical protein
LEGRTLQRRRAVAWIIERALMSTLSGDDVAALLD